MFFFKIMFFSFFCNDFYSLREKHVVFKRKNIIFAGKEAMDMNSEKRTG